MPFTKHGHPFGVIDPGQPVTFGEVAHCGGPGLCRECSAEAGALPQIFMAGFDPRQSEWRAGRKLGRTIYAQTPGGADVLVGMVESRELAEHIVAAHNQFIGVGF